MYPLYPFAPYKIEIFIPFRSTTLRFRDMAKLTLPLTLTLPFFSETPPNDSSLPLCIQEGRNFYTYSLYDAPFLRYGQVNLTPNPNLTLFLRNSS